MVHAVGSRPPPWETWVKFHASGVGQAQPLWRAFGQWTSAQEISVWLPLCLCPSNKQEQRCLFFISFLACLLIHLGRGLRRCLRALCSRLPHWHPLHGPGPRVHRGVLNARPCRGDRRTSRRAAALLGIYAAVTETLMTLTGAHGARAGGGGTVRHVHLAGNGTGATWRMRGMGVPEGHSMGAGSQAASVTVSHTRGEDS